MGDAAHAWSCAGVHTGRWMGMRWLRRSVRQGTSQGCGRVYPSASAHAAACRLLRRHWCCPVPAPCFREHLGVARAIHCSAWCVCGTFACIHHAVHFIVAKLFMAFHTRAVASYFSQLLVLIPRRLPLQPLCVAIAHTHTPHTTHHTPHLKPTTNIPCHTPLKRHTHTHTHTHTTRPTSLSRLGPGQALVSPLPQPPSAATGTHLRRSGPPLGC